MEELNEKPVATILEKLNNGVIEGILVLLKPEHEIENSSKY